MRCIVSYFEGKNQVGGTSLISMNGFLVTCSKLRNESTWRVSEKEKQLIGSGAYFYKSGQEIFVEYLSDSSLFVQCSNYENYMDFGCDTVIEVPSFYGLKIFDLNNFLLVLEEAVKFKQIRVLNQLKKHCTIRLSFDEEWGSQYKEKDITTSSCWIEIQLQELLDWLDIELEKLYSCRCI
jgi:MAD (mothers against decapentaplegic) family protein 1